MGVLEVLRMKYREEMNNLADDISTGAATDFGHYQKMVGVIEGLAIAERHLLNIEEAVEKAEQ